MPSVKAIKNSKSVQSSDGTIMVAKVLVVLAGIPALFTAYYLIALAVLPEGSKKCGSEICSIVYPDGFGFLGILDAIGFLAIFAFFPLLLFSLIGLSLLLSPKLRRRYTKNKNWLIPFIAMGFIGTIPGFFWLFSLGLGVLQIANSNS